MKLFARALIASIALPAVTFAQTSVPNEKDGSMSASKDGVAENPSCELHVWPGPALGSVYHGWLHGGIVNGAIQGRQGYTPITSNPVDSAEQVILLGAANLPQLMKLPSYKQVIHNQPLESTVLRSASARLSESIASCYAELIVEKVMFQEDVINGRSLKILARFRKFGTGQTVERLFGTWAQSSVRLFPPDKPEDDAAAADELRTAYLGNLSIFANYLNNPVKSKTGRSKATKGDK